MGGVGPSESDVDAERTDDVGAQVGQEGRSNGSLPAFLVNRVEVIEKGGAVPPAGAVDLVCVVMCVSRVFNVASSVCGTETTLLSTCAPLSVVTSR